MIEFLDLQKQQIEIKSAIEKRISSVLEHGKYILGPEVSELEDKLANYAGVEHSITCSSGTDALLISLMANDIGPGDAVFTTSFSYVATAEVIKLLGAEVIFCDIDKKTYNIDPDSLQNKYEETSKKGLNPKAIIVHTLKLKVKI